MVRVSTEATPTSAIAEWVWALVGIAVVCCIVLILYFVGFAALPKPSEEDARLEELITELEQKHPDIDFDEVRKEIYAAIPDVTQGSEYAKLSSIEAQMLVDEAVRLHDEGDRKSKRSTIFNPPFRGLLRSRHASSSASAQYGQIPTFTDAVQVNAKAPVRTESQYGIIPQRRPKIEEVR